MKDIYYKLLVVPSDKVELFSDFVLEYTGEAIEEVCHNHKEAFIVYSEDNLKPLIHALEQFTQCISTRLEQNITCDYFLSEEKNEDWINKYRHSITPIVCGSFFVRPSWCPPHSSLIDIIIEPALAFGSGHHESTSSCLEILSTLDINKKRILDIGCGSGILSIAALKLGGFLDMCDTDSLAISESLKNLHINNVSANNIWHGSLNQAEGCYHIIMANLISAVLLALSKQFMVYTSSGSLVLLSGILLNAKASILEQFVGFNIQQEIIKNEWVTLLLCKE